MVKPEDIAEKSGTQGAKWFVVGMVNYALRNPLKKSGRDVRDRRSVKKKRIPESHRTRGIS